MAQNVHRRWKLPSRWVFDVRCSMFDVFLRIGPSDGNAAVPGLQQSHFRFDRLENRVGIGKFARLQFGIDLFPIDADLKGAAA